MRVIRPSNEFNRVSIYKDSTNKLLHPTYINYRRVRVFRRCATYMPAGFRAHSAPHTVASVFFPHGDGAAAHIPFR
jgi:hypothetical protein